MKLSTNYMCKQMTVLLQYKKPFNCGQNKSTQDCLKCYLQNVFTNQVFSIYV